MNPLTAPDTRHVQMRDAAGPYAIAITDAGRVYRVRGMVAQELVAVASDDEVDPNARAPISGEGD